MTAERQRLSGDTHAVARWRKWGPYVADRAWGTVREDYSADGDAWKFFTHDQARSKAYRWGEDDPEFELLDTGIFDDRRYFDIEIEVAKEDPETLVMRVTAHNRGPDRAPLHLIPQLWFRNTWSWSGEPVASPLIKAIDGDGRPALLADDS